MPRLRATTILAVRQKGAVAIGGDGQVTLGNIVMKADAHKIRRLHGGEGLTGLSAACLAADAGFASAGAFLRPASRTFKEMCREPPPSWPRTGAPIGSCVGWRRC